MALIYKPCGNPANLPPGMVAWQVGHLAYIYGLILGVIGVIWLLWLRKGVQILHLTLHLTPMRTYQPTRLRRRRPGLPHQERQYSVLAPFRASALHEWCALPFREPIACVAIGARAAAPPARLRAA